MGGVGNNGGVGTAHRGSGGVGTAPLRREQQRGGQQPRVDTNSNNGEQPESSGSMLTMAPSLGQEGGLMVVAASYS
jgi:hypothetical protein